MGFSRARTAPDLAEMFQLADDRGAGLSAVLPTARYVGRDDALRNDIHNFMDKLLSGQWGHPPRDFIFEIGNEFYATFNGVDDQAAAYGHIANIYVEEISAALNDPSVNLIGADIQIAVQCGRTEEQDDTIRAEFENDNIAEVDLLIHHRFSFRAEGVDKSADAVHSYLDAWKTEAQDAGGQGPDLYLSTYNVASLTRAEALDSYLDIQHAAGNDIDASDINLDTRNDVDFENYWQNELGKRDYGAEHPRVLLEMFSEYGGEGAKYMGVYGVDMPYAGRFTTTDVHGNNVDFVGQDALDMMEESLVGTRMLKMSLENDANDDVWIYGFESKDKLVVFLSAGDKAPGDVTLDLAGLGSTYRQVWGDSLTSDVPDDWMSRFGIRDNAKVNETNEGNTYAVGVRNGFTPDIDADGVTVHMDTAHELVRLSFAKTGAGARDIAGYSDGSGVMLAGPSIGIGADNYDEDDMADDMDDTAAAHHHHHKAILPMIDPSEDASDDEDNSDDVNDIIDSVTGDGHVAGGILAALLPVLMLAGL